MSKFVKLERKIGGALILTATDVVAMETCKSNANETLVWSQSISDEDGNPVCYRVVGQAEDVLARVIDALEGE